MTLDINRRRQVLQLFDAYGPLLTEHQRETLRLHLAEDWSYAEIAASQGVSRSAVHDLVRRSEIALDDYEARLGLVVAAERRDSDRVSLERHLDGLQDELKILRRAVKEIS